MANVATTAKKDPGLPAHLQGVQKTAKIGNIDRSDIIIPRVKLLQMISPEVEEFEAAKAGDFWHTVLGESLGSSIKVVPVILRKTYVLWAPRGDDRGILARASDGMHWDTPNMTFTVKPKNSPTPVDYELGEMVGKDIGLGRFGTSIPGDPGSAPAASLTFEVMFVFPDHPDIGPALVINTRSAVRPALELISKTELRPVDHYAQQYEMSAVKQKGNEGDFYNYRYASAGYADEAVCAKAKELYEIYSQTAFKANDEQDDTKPDHGGGDTAKPKGNANSGKF